MRSSSWSAALVFACFLVVPLGDAQAQPTGLDSLEQQLADGLEELSTADCEVACRSLESMSRAADRICELDAGPRCDEAQRKVEEAAGRVRDACPDCATDGDDDDDATVTGTADEEERNMLREESTGAPASTPPAENRGAAGCAACSVGERTRDPLAPLAALTFFLAAALATARRRRR